MTDQIKCEIWLAMNHCGDWIVTKDDDALDKLSEEEGLGDATRVVKLTVFMKKPHVAEGIVSVADDVGEQIEAKAE